MQDNHIIAHYHSNIYRTLKIPLIKLIKNIKPTDINAKRTEIIIKLGMHKNKQVAFLKAIWVVPVGFTYFY